jgi:LPXTG-site transpeptidase (sortase) family protein
LNGGADAQVNFNVLILDPVRSNPKTGFAPGVVTVLPEQPAEKAYTDLGNLWIEIPALQLKTSITGVPLKDGGWDVTWLHRQVGWLEGTAYPTWEGNTVLTAHSYTADGNVGPFALLQYLKYGDPLLIHLGGMKYTYAVRTNLLIKPNDTHWLTRHEKLGWVTLITCQQYDDKTKSYRYRRVVRAVLISVEQE